MEGRPNPKLVSAVRPGYLEAAADIQLYKSISVLHEEEIERETELRIREIQARSILSHRGRYTYLSALGSFLGQRRNRQGEHVRLVGYICPFATI